MGRAHEVRAASMAKTAAMKSSKYAKWGKEIFQAAKAGVPDPDMNQSLKRTIERAKKDQCPADVIKRAIAKAQGVASGASKEKVYERYGPGNVAVIVECLTDNKNRTAGDVRHAFDKFGGSLGSTGCVSYLFNRKGIVEVSLDGKDLDELMMDALECGALDVVDYDQICEIVTEQNQHNQVADQLKNKGYEVLSAETMLIPDSYVDLEEEKLTKFTKMIEMLEDLDDVQEVYHNVNLPNDDE